MKFNDITEISGDYRHVYIAPHMDDAALSCGGAIATYRAHNIPVLVVTLLTAHPSGPYNAVAQEFHGQWRLETEDVVGIRRREDAEAMAILAADYVWAERLDAIYRCPEAYVSRETLFAPPIPDDPLIPDMAQILIELRERLPDATFYLPLGVGDHVDHLIAFDAARMHGGEKLAFYEDVHYVLQPGAIERRLEAIGEQMSAATIEISAGLERKIAAISKYASQMDALFGGEDEMVRQMTAYAARLRPEGGAYGERIWRRAATGSAA
jgi:LmbE family N-acetylglucosaminyl deacetylase